MTSLQRNENPDPFVSENFSLKFDKEVRLGFIRKVYGILSTQLLFTTGFCVMACWSNIFHTTTGWSKGFETMLGNNTLLWVNLATSLISIIALVCFKLDKRVPANYILLAVFTFSNSWIVGFCCTQYNPITVLEAACLTLSVTIAITVYAFTTSTDFTIFGPILFIVGFVFCTAGILMAVFGYQPGLLWSVLGVLLFSFYLLFDTQMIMGGDKKRYQFDEDSYILAAVCLYMDIINIFFYMLAILGEKK